MGYYNELTLEPDFEGTCIYNGPMTWTEQPTQTRAPRKTYVIIRSRKQITIRTEIDGIFESTFHYQRNDKGWQSAKIKAAKLNAAGYECIEGAQ